MALTVCPLSHLRLRVVDALERHPLRRMMQRDLLVTVNSDDPAYFGGYVNDNFRAVRGALGLERDEIVALARNSFTAAMMPAEERAAALAAFDRVVAKLP
jgi:adenosine deaminase